MTTTATFAPATPRQISFLRTLHAERDMPFDPDAYALTSKTEASAEITRVKALPRTPVVQPEPGFYITDDGTALNVVKTRDGERVYAKRFVTTIDAAGRPRGHWEYAPGMGTTVAGIEPMTVEQAGAIGLASGTCLVCGKALTDPASVNGRGEPGQRGYRPAGIGPTCAKRFAQN